jgi:endogenous inhibitor of DNA gyrase (YacG/DUF329 family)
MSKSTDSGRKDASKSTGGRARPCPICAKLSLIEHYPFCSPRCREVDLNRWLSGVYTLPAVDDESVPDGGERE